MVDFLISLLLALADPPILCYIRTEPLRSLWVLYVLVYSRITPVETPSFH